VFWSAIREVCAGYLVDRASRLELGAMFRPDHNGGCSSESVNESTVGARRNPKICVGYIFGPHRGHGTLSVYDCGLRADLIPAHQAVREPCEGANSGLNARLPADEDRNLVFVQSWRG